MTQEPDIKRWTAKRKAELIKQIYRGQTTVPEAARHYDLTQQEIEKWMDDAEAGMENALKANPKDIAEQYETQLRELREAYGEAMLELKFRKSCSAISTRPTIDRSGHGRDGYPRRCRDGGAGLPLGRCVPPQLLLSAYQSQTQGQ